MTDNAKDAALRDAYRAWQEATERVRVHVATPRPESRDYPDRVTYERAAKEWEGARYDLNWAAVLAQRAAIGALHAWADTGGVSPYPVRHDAVAVGTEVAP